jgi:hypothetical protein
LVAPVSVSSWSSIRCTSSRPRARPALPRQVELHRREAVGDRVARRPQALDLGLDLVVAHVVVRDVDPARGDEHGPPDRDASGNRQAEELEGHCDRS